jgi:putative membrane protein insertion efficiency factor
MKSLALWLISVYQKNVGPHVKAGCQFYPTCSEYTKQAIEKYGFTKGVYLGARRILRCRPGVKNHMDPLK